MEVDNIRDMSFHDPEHKFEKKYWGDCTNTFLEEQKHYVQARLMGIVAKNWSFDAGGKRILDIGGGPVSMLLKTYNLREGVVCDPTSQVRRSALPRARRGTCRMQGHSFLSLAMIKASRGDRVAARAGVVVLSGAGPARPCFATV